MIHDYTNHVYTGKFQFTNSRSLQSDCLEWAEVGQELQLEQAEVRDEYSDGFGWWILCPAGTEHTMVVPVNGLCGVCTGGAGAAIQ